MNDDDCDWPDDKDVFEADTLPPGPSEIIQARGELTIFERKTGETEWREIRREHNLITNVGYLTIANTLTNTGSYVNKHYTYFAWGDGATAPAIADTATTFYADCANSDTKAVTSIEAFNTGLLIQQWNCFLSTADNAVTSITKFALMDADPGVAMFNEILFAPITKNAAVEFYMRYRLTFSQV